MDKSKIDQSKIDQIKIEIKFGVHLRFRAGTKFGPPDRCISLQSNMEDIMSITSSKKDAWLSNYCPSDSLSLQSLIYGFRIPMVSYLFLV